MTVILRHLPFYDRPTLIEAQGRKFLAMSRQIVLWVSVSPFGPRSAAQQLPVFPAVLDTGFNDSFLIHESHLRDLARLDQASMTMLSGRLVAGGRRFPIYAANLWLHRNCAGKHDLLVGQPPPLLELHRGIAVCTDSEIRPRLPVVGMRALRQHELQLHVDYRNCRVSLWTSRRWWPYG